MAGIELCKFTHGLGLYILRFYPSLSLRVKFEYKGPVHVKFAQLYACHELFLKSLTLISPKVHIHCHRYHFFQFHCQKLSFNQEYVSLCYICMIFKSKQISLTVKGYTVNVLVQDLLPPRLGTG